jgi:uncharacterized protein (DUF1697 family)
MTVRLVALLRGVNVGGNKRVPMGALRTLLVDLGYGDVVTHLNSGNAVFTCSSGAAARAAQAVEDGIREVLGVQCAVVTRSAAELDSALATDPLGDVATDPARHLIGFLSGEPAPEVVAYLEGLEVAPDQVRVVGREVYLWLPAGIAESRLGKTGWERKLGVTVTARNVNTVRKLAQLAGMPPQG